MTYKSNTDSKRSLLSKTYKRIAKLYDNRYAGGKGIVYNGLEFSVLKMIDPAGKLALDVGTGTGRVVKELAELGYQPIGGDISLEMLQSSSVNNSFCSFVQLDALKLPFADNSFGLITCYGLFEYIVDISPYLAEFHRVLQPNGHLVFTSHNSEALKKSVNLDYRIEYHTQTGIANALAKSNFTLLYHKTTFYLSGRVAWGVMRLLKLISMDLYFARFLLRAEAFMSSTTFLGGKGRVHIVIAQTQSR